jgi:hypothetical protein
VLVLLQCAVPVHASLSHVAPKQRAASTAVDRLALTTGSQGVDALWRSIPHRLGVSSAPWPACDPYGSTVTPVSLIVNPLPLPAPVSTVQVIAVLAAWQRYP